jgi:hypothetical protein
MPIRLTPSLATDGKAFRRGTLPLLLPRLQIRNADCALPQRVRPAPTYDGGREKSPAAISRKVAKATDGGEIDIWGDGDQTRSYMYVDDCVEGLIRLMASQDREALNLGTDEVVGINHLVDMICEIAGKKLTKVHDLSKPQGVRGRNSYNALFCARSSAGSHPCRWKRLGPYLQVDCQRSEEKRSCRIGGCWRLTGTYLINRFGTGTASAAPLIGNKNPDFSP